ncbi:MAG: ABC transporter ATP-binding protein [Planctomycetaceae bacterium]|nr:ABC transporter ATP-binding protein [Planctomycetaceae bacterium]
MIQIRDVTKTHLRGETEVRALRGVSCEIERGSFSFIVGPSGSGKSTLLYLMGALDEPTSGEIIVDGQSLGGLSQRARDQYRPSDVGLIFQSFNLQSNLTAVENVLVPFLPRGVSGELRQRAIDLLVRVGLAGRLDHRPNQLSGGEQQRVAIARALLKHPKLVLADEPTGELDSKSGQEVFAYLRELHESQNTTVIVVTHDERYFTDQDRVITLQDGQVVPPSVERLP